MNIAVSLDLCQENNIFFIFSYKKFGGFRKMLYLCIRNQNKNGF
jgi:hypothetical protein